jgi:hypothetical protein
MNGISHGATVDPYTSIQDLTIAEYGVTIKPSNLLRFVDDVGDGIGSTKTQSSSAPCVASGNSLHVIRLGCKKAKRIYRKMAFQQAVTDLYGQRCMITGRCVSGRAMHIIPQRKCSNFTQSVLWNRFNGLILCREARLLFHTGHLRVDDKLRLEFSVVVHNSRTYREMCRHRHLHIPRKYHERAQWFLRWHHSHWGATFREREMRDLERQLRRKL